MRCDRDLKQDGGFALLIVLWTLVPLSLLFIMLASASRSDAQLTANLRGAAELEAVADGAIYGAVFTLLQGVPARSAGAPGVEVISLSGLVNPNVAPPELLQALLVRLRADPREAGQVAGAIVAWRTPGQQTKPNGGRAPLEKIAEYQAAGLDHGPPGAPFETIGELLEVRGMTPTLLAALAPHLTLYSEGEPDPALADPIVRGALRDVGITSRGPANNQVVRITATVRRSGSMGTDGIRAARRAVLRIGPSQNGRGWRVLSWESWNEG